MSKIKQIFLLHFFFFIILIHPSFLESNKFIDGVEDLPLHEKMEFVENSLILFDTNEGRIVQLDTKGKVEKKVVKDFYNQLLPNLGWRLVKENKFSRQDEIIEIEFSEKNDFLFLKFRIFSK